MKEGRVFALTGPQMLELEALCHAASRYYSGIVQVPAMGMVRIAERWRHYLRREHAAHFGTEEASDE